MAKDIPSSKHEAVHLRREVVMTGGSDPQEGVQADPTGRSLTDDFAHYYRLDPDSERSAFDEGLIVLDTNVLLNILRYSSPAREELLQVIEKIGERCFIPYQIALEYNRNRVSVVADHHKELETIEKSVGEVRSSLRTLVATSRKRRILSEEVAQNLDDAATELMDEIGSEIANAITQYDLNAPSMVGRVDQWTARLMAALAGKVASAPSEQQREADTKEAGRRREAQLAPGFKDKVGGDYLWWAETLRNPDIKGRKLLVISDDVAKGDWLFEQHGITIGPHEILMSDAKKAGATGVWLATTRDLLKHAEDAGLTQVSEATLAESERLLDTKPAVWNLEGFIGLVVALDNEGYRDRVRVIRAAADAGGYLERESVYKIIGREESERSLRQFSTPVLRITRRLVNDGVVADGADEALGARYDGPGKAVGYAVPDDFAEFNKVLMAAESFIADQATLDWPIREQGRAQLHRGLKRMLSSHNIDGDVEGIADDLLDRAERQVEQTDAASVE